MHQALAAYGRFAARHPLRVIAIWLFFMVAIGVSGVLVGQATDNTITLPGSESAKAQDIRNADFPDTAKGSGSIVFTSTSVDFRTSAGQADLQRVTDSVRQAQHVTQAVVGANSVSSTGDTAFISVSFDLDSRAITKPIAQATLDAAVSHAPPQVSVLPGGQIATVLARQDTHSSELIGIVAAAIILLIALGTAVAMALPIVSAVLGLLLGMAGIALLSQLSPIPTVSGTIATMLSLGVGIDYALFLVTRYRSARLEGTTVAESVGAAVSRAGSAVLFAGVTVIVALSGLWLAGVPFLGSLSWVASVGVLGAMLTCLLLLPAVIGLLGDRIERGALPKRSRTTARPGGWERIGEATSRRPWLSALASLLILGVIASPTLLLQLGQTDDGNAPSSQLTRQSYDALKNGFGAGANGPLLVVMELHTSAGTASSQQLKNITTALSAEPGVKSVAGPQLSTNGNAAQWTVIPTTAPSDPATATLVTQLRDHTLPASEGGFSALVGGQTAAKADFAAIIAAHLVEIILVVVAASSVLLFFAFRSFVIPLTAAAMNLVSVLAAYGVLVFVFQEGHGIRLTGLDAKVPIEAFVPLMLFAVLFGLSMDYQVFLLSAIQEQWHRFGDNRRAVVAGLGSTGRVITSAALIMMSVFISFVPNPDPTVKMFGLGMAVAVLIDATVVRGLLVPALMTLLGRANWWLPRRIDRVLPRMTIEG